MKPGSAALMLGYRFLGFAARLLRIRRVPGRWHTASNNHRYLESA
ncbi:hypothetical protein [Amycolatopsis silviterrae]|uniref:Uncharacterized protein n=1 Tax=Amycolatopsis silviterrae TaxID=1656914 RepID=A0ABW5HGT4_9PSEU